MEFEVKKSMAIDEGKHIGKIVAVEYRTEPYEYTDFVFELMDKGNEGTKIKTGFPTFVSPDSKLGKFMGLMGVELVVGMKLDPEQAMIGKWATFTTFNETKQKGTFARIVQESIKRFHPVKQTTVTPKSNVDLFDEQQKQKTQQPEPTWEGL